MLNLVQNDWTTPHPGGGRGTKGYLLICEKCGDLGFATRSHARYCSKSCKDNAKAMRTYYRRKAERS